MLRSSLQKRCRRIRGFAAAGIVAALLLLTGCSDFVDRDQLHVEPGAEVTLEPGHPVGQTFVARHAGLTGIEVWLEPGQDSQGEIYLHLRSDPQAEEDLVTAVLPLAQSAAPGFYHFSFPSLRHSHGRYYYAFLEMSGEGKVQIGAGPGNGYLDGALYRNHEPLDAQMAFRLVYSPRHILLDLGQAVAGGLGLLLVAGLLYVVPGWALLAWLWPGARLSWAERLGLAGGISLALYPLLLLWTDLVGLHLGPLYAWGSVVGGLLALAWCYRRWQPRQGWEALKQWARSEALWPDLALLAVTGLVFGVRLLVVRTLDAPMWGDSYQHTMIAQLLVDNGGLFDAWEPYAPYRSLTVHFGFPTAVALFSWATGIGSVQATLLVGQLINGLAAFTLYPLAVRIADGSRWAGVGAVLVTGLLSPMPAFYVNWGRYAQLAGQAILPVALWLLWETALHPVAANGSANLLASPVGRKPRLRDWHLCRGYRNKTSPSLRAEPQAEGSVEAFRHPFKSEKWEKQAWKAASLAGTTLSGMTLAYYRMPFYYVPFVLAWLIGWGLPHWGVSVRHWLKGFARLALIAGIALLLFLPWGLHVAGGRLATALSAGIAAGSPLDRVLADYQVWRDIAFYVPWPLVVAALVALAWSLARWQWVVASVGLWVLGLASLVAGRLIRLPGANLMQNFAVLIALYIPVGLLVGWLIGQVAGLVQRWAGKAGRWAMGMAVAAAAMWAAVGQMRIVQPSYVMVTHPDVRAMAWIRENTPPEARFLVEGFRIYGGRSAVGADAGWWIPLLARRQNTMPPQYALVNEVPAEAGYTQRVVDLVAQLEPASPGSPDRVRLLCDWGVTQVYIGQGQGKVGAGAVQLFSPDALATNPVFSNVYQQDRVYIFALNPQACGAGSR